MKGNWIFTKIEIAMPNISPTFIHIVFSYSECRQNISSCQNCWSKLCLQNFYHWNKLVWNLQGVNLCISYMYMVKNKYWNIRKVIGLKIFKKMFVLKCVWLCAEEWHTELSAFTVSLHVCELCTEGCPLENVWQKVCSCLNG